MCGDAQAAKKAAKIKSTRTRKIPNLGLTDPLYQKKKDYCIGARRFKLAPWRLLVCRLVCHSGSASNATLTVFRCLARIPAANSL
jgi:hypothetical protein